MIRKTFAAILLLAAGASGCAESESTATDAPKACKGATYTWEHKSRWIPIVLDEARTVSRGDELKIAGDPYRPWSSSLKTDQNVNAPDEILKELGRKLDKPLADVGRSTKSEAMPMTTEFAGDKAQAVYFQGIERIDATFTLTCTGQDRPINGQIVTWNTRSNSFGTVDCLKPLSANPTEPLARVAAATRCPKDSVLARETVAR
ncbi:hypothetical protein ACFW3A_17300 [Streptomyces pilosus]|uniref:hypothetical protein n=1 Tax=Streptomyces pilosus TaxID=28893 RepID=UPI00362C3741